MDKWVEKFMGLSLVGKIGVGMGALVLVLVILSALGVVEPNNIPMNVGASDK